MNKINLICNQCDGNIIFNSKTHRGYCESCGREYLFTPENIGEDPEKFGYEWQRGVNRAIEEQARTIKTSNSQNNYSKPTQTPTPARKSSSTAVTVCTIVAIIVFLTYILPLFVAYSFKNTSKNAAPNKTTNSSSSRNYSDYEDVVHTSTTVDTESIPEQPQKVYLTDLIPFSGLNFRLLNNEKDIFENQYRTGFSASHERASTWRLDGQYKKLTFTSGVPSYCRGADPKIYSADIRIYTDDSLVFETTLNPLSESGFVELDVTNCKDLRIEMEGVYWYLEPAIFDPILYK